MAEGSGGTLMVDVLNANMMPPTLVPREQKTRTTRTCDFFLFWAPKGPGFI